MRVRRWQYRPWCLYAAILVLGCLSLWERHQAHYYHQAAAEGWRRAGDAYSRLSDALTLCQDAFPQEPNDVPSPQVPGTPKGTPAAATASLLDWTHDGARSADP